MQIQNPFKQETFTSIGVSLESNSHDLKIMEDDSESCVVGIGVMVKPQLGMSGSHIQVPGFESWFFSLFQVSSS